MISKSSQYMRRLCVAPPGAGPAAGGAFPGRYGGSGDNNCCHKAGPEGDSGTARAKPFTRGIYCGQWQPRTSFEFAFPKNKSLDTYHRNSVHQYLRYGSVSR